MSLLENPKPLYEALVPILRFLRATVEAKGWDGVGRDEVVEVSEWGEKSESRVTRAVCCCGHVGYGQISESRSERGVQVPDKKIPHHPQGQIIPKVGEHGSVDQASDDHHDADDEVRELVGLASKLASNLTWLRDTVKSAEVCFDEGYTTGLVESARCVLSRHGYGAAQESAVDQADGKNHGKPSVAQTGSKTATEGSHDGNHIESSSTLSTANPKVSNETSANNLQGKDGNAEDRDMQIPVENDVDQAKAHEKPMMNKESGVESSTPNDHRPAQDQAVRVDDTHLKEDAVPSITKSDGYDGMAVIDFADSGLHNTADDADVSSSKKMETDCGMSKAEDGELVVEVPESENIDDTPLQECSNPQANESAREQTSIDEDSSLFQEGSESKDTENHHELQGTGSTNDEAPTNPAVIFLEAQGVSVISDHPEVEEEAKNSENFFILEEEGNGLQHIFVGSLNTFSPGSMKPVNAHLGPVDRTLTNFAYVRDECDAGEEMEVVGRVDEHVESEESFQDEEATKDQELVEGGESGQNDDKEAAEKKELIQIKDEAEGPAPSTPSTQAEEPLRSQETAEAKEPTQNDDNAQDASYEYPKMVAPRRLPFEKKEYSFIPEEEGDGLSHVFVGSGHAGGADLAGDGVLVPYDGTLTNFRNVDAAVGADAAEMVPGEDTGGEGGSIRDRQDDPGVEKESLTTNQEKSETDQQHLANTEDDPETNEGASKSSGMNGQESVHEEHYSDSADGKAKEFEEVQGSKASKLTQIADDTVQQTGASSIVEQTTISTYNRTVKIEETVTKDSSNDEATKDVAQAAQTSSIRVEKTTSDNNPNSTTLEDTVPKERKYPKFDPVHAAETFEVLTPRVPSGTSTTTTASTFGKRNVSEGSTTHNTAASSLSSSPSPSDIAKEIDAITTQPQAKKGKKSKKGKKGKKSEKSSPAGDQEKEDAAAAVSGATISAPIFDEVDMEMETKTKAKSKTKTKQRNAQRKRARARKHKKVEAKGEEDGVVQGEKSEENEEGKGEEEGEEDVEGL